MMLDDLLNSSKYDRQIRPTEHISEFPKRKSDADRQNGRRSEDKYIRMRTELVYIHFLIISR